MLAVTPMQIFNLWLIGGAIVAVGSIITLMWIGAFDSWSASTVTILGAAAGTAVVLIANHRRRHAHEKNRKDRAQS